MNSIKMIYIILVNYNGYKDTIECIKSINCIKNIEYKVVVVDNGSTEEYPDEMLKCEKNPRVIVIKSKENLGFSGGNNIGIRYALEHRADYVLLLNNDTIVTQNFINPLLEIEKQYNDLAVLTPKILYNSNRELVWYAGGTFNYKTSRTTHSNINTLDKKDKKKSENVSFISGCCMFIPAKVFQKVGFMNEEYFLYCEDIDFSCRIYQAGYKLVYTPNSVIYHKVGSSSGKLAGIETYYTVRNKLYVIKMFIPKNYKCIAYSYNLAEIVKRCITREYPVKFVIKGIKDFLHKKKGKMTL